MKKLATQPLQGFRDFLPDDWKIQSYIFNTWKSVCERYGYREYNGPVLENVEIYNKSGDDVGAAGKELYAFTDRGDRHVALRPEMTPTVGRMVAAYGKQFSKPIRWFSIAQFFRAEKPQRGRGREFFQLNADIFGVDSVYADFEVIDLAINILVELKATDEMFKVKINNRKFSDYYFSVVLNLKDEGQKRAVLKLIDAYPKNGDNWLYAKAAEMGLEDLHTNLKKYLSLSAKDIKGMHGRNEGVDELIQLFDLIESAGLSKYCELDTTIARGFDYYTGMVFEVFDLNPQNNRSMFGGGRYDDLLNLFGDEKMPAVGFAPGDITTKLFLESWGLLEGFDMNDKETFYIPILNSGDFNLYKEIADDIRRGGSIAELSLSETTISDALKFANKNKINYVVIMGEDEKKHERYKLKNMETGEERPISFA
jgi:histidyl-tRNA synthetase